MPSCSVMRRGRRALLQHLGVGVRGGLRRRGRLARARPAPRRLSPIGPAPRFEQAKKSAPCIIFIDEIDAVGRQRSAGFGQGNDEREQTVRPGEDDFE